jgi:hypothetical protein
MPSITEREDVRPISTLDLAAAAVVREAAAGPRATRIVDGEESIAVLLSPARYDELLDAAARLELVYALDEAEESIAAGRTTPHEEVLPLLLRWADESV